MKQLILTLLVIVAAFRLEAQSTITSESFDSTVFPPAGWSIKQPVLAASNTVWVRRTNGQNGTTVICQPHSGTGLARYNSRVVVNGYTQNLVSKKVDYTNRGTQPATIDFWMYRDSLKVWLEDSVTVFINTTDSLDANAVRLGAVARNRTIMLPDTQATQGWFLYSFPVPASFNTGTNYFIFRGTSNNDTINQGCNIFIDDVSYTEYPPYCTGVPNVGNILAPSLVCNGGDTIALSLTSTVASPLGISYDWQSSSSASGPFTSIGNTSTITNYVSTNTFYKCIVSCSYSGQTYSTPVALVSVIPDTTPVISAGAIDGVICPSETAILFASGAPTFTWSSGATVATSNGDTATATPTANTVYTVTGINTSGCSASAIVSIGVAQLPNVIMTVLPNDTVCAGDSIIMNCLQGPASGNIYQWSNGVTTRRDTVIVSASATYSVIVTNSFGCSNTGSINITAIPATTGGFTGTVNLLTLNVTSTATNALATTYNFGDGSALDPNPNTSHTYTSPGAYTVTQTVYGVCDTVVTTKNFLVTAQSVNDEALRTPLKLYPNPVHKTLNIESTLRFTTVDIINSVGQVILSMPVGNSNKHSINVEALPAGVYTICTGSQFTRFEKL